MNAAWLSWSPASRRRTRPSACGSGGALKATGAGVLRDGVYVLPERPDLQEVLAGLAAEISEAGGNAHVLRVEPRDDAQDEALRALVDRTKEYAALVDEVGRARNGSRAATRPPSGVRAGRSVGQLDAIVAIDFFPRGDQGAGRGRPAGDGGGRDGDPQPGEPHGQRGPIPRLDAASTVGASGPLARRHGWTGSPCLAHQAAHRSGRLVRVARDPRGPAEGGRGFDFDGAPFTHVESASRSRSC